jgi:hypothetical protein
VTAYIEEFILPRSFTEATSFTLLVCERLEQHLGQAVPHPEMLQRARWIIMELNTNNVKHTNAQDARLLISFDGKDILVEKRDNCRPLALSVQSDGKNCCWPLDEQFYNSKFDVYGDDVHTLTAEIDTSGVARFSVIEQTDRGTEQKINEHFGLLIMARASEEFTYRHDIAAKENIFSCRIMARNY